MTKGISNIEIEKLFKEINNDDLNENFLDVYPSDKINKLIMFQKMMPGKNILSWFQTWTEATKAGRDTLVDYNEHFAKK